MPWLPVLHSPADVERFVAERLLPGADVWVAEVGGAVAAYAARAGTELDHLYVDPGHQGRGLGGALLARAAERAPGPLQLWTFARNARARAFYERRGFVAVRETDGAGNEEHEPDVRYVGAPRR
jgi:GNAT superfamily N-acetyltransferase